MAGSLKISPLAPETFPDVPLIDGVRFASVAAGVRYQGRTDVMLAELAPGTTVAGVFTKSLTRSAPVLDCQEKLGSDPSNGAVILVNSGNSNAFTGKYGVESVQAITSAVSEIMDVPLDRVFTSSTGVIGEPMAHERIVSALSELKEGLSDSAFKAAAEAIMTTDTYPKAASATAETEQGSVTIAGMAKGSGMIAPDVGLSLYRCEDFTD